jgi:hypothetical protein
MFKWNKTKIQKIYQTFFIIDASIVIVIHSLLYMFKLINIMNSLLTKSYTRVLSLKVCLVEQELSTLPKHMKSLLGFSGIHFPRSWVFWVMFCRSLFGFLFFLSYCALCTSFIYEPLVIFNFLFKISANGLKIIKI